MTALVVAAVSARTPTCCLPRPSRRQEARAIGNFSHFGDMMRKDFQFLKKGITKGIDWANETLQIPKVFKSLDDVLWLKNLEDPQAPPLEHQSWPQPSYPGSFHYAKIYMDN